MKRIVVLALVASMILSFACCNRQSDAKTDFNEENNIAQTPEITEPLTEYRTQIDTETLARAVFSCRYPIQDSGFSIQVGEVVDRCCDTNTISSDYWAYQEAKNEIIPSEYINQIENGPYKEYLNNSYIVEVNGTILQNPEIEYFYSDYQTIITLVLHFDENDNFVGLGYWDPSDDFHRCATILSVGSIHF